MIISVCCDCGKAYDSVDDGKNEIQESHGYCEPCFSKAQEAIRKQIDELGKGECQY